MIRIQDIEVAPWHGLRHCTCDAWLCLRGQAPLFIGRHRRMGGRISRAHWVRIVSKCPAHRVDGRFEPIARCETSKIRGTIDVGQSTK